MDDENLINYNLGNDECVIQFHREKRRNTVKQKLQRLETLESKLSLNVKIDRNNFSKQSTNLFDKVFVKTKQLRYDKFGTPIMKNGLQKVTFSNTYPQIKIFHNHNTVYQDRLHEINSIDRIKNDTVVKRRKEECKCACMIF